MAKSKWKNLSGIKTCFQNLTSKMLCQKCYKMLIAIVLVLPNVFIVSYEIAKCIREIMNCDKFFQIQTNRYSIPRRDSIHHSRCRIY